MKRCRNNESRIIRYYKLLALSSQLSAFCFTLLALCFIFGWILYPDMATSGPYLDSAHGNTTYGVKRTTSTGFPDYTWGLCAHCHEQHSSIGGNEPQPVDGHPSKYLLLSDFVSQFDVPCFDCHTETIQLQDPTGANGNQMNQQYSYSRIAGGAPDPNDCPNNINRAFAFITSDCTLSRAGNCGSSVGSAHCLKDIAILLKNMSTLWGFNSVAANNDPCSGCHNPHRAQRDPHTSTGRITNEKLVSSVSRPSKHSTDNNAWDLWGDDASERMDVASNYQYWAPYRVGGGYEPDGSSTRDGSNLASHAYVCNDCHNTTNAIYSTRLGRNLTNINWGGGGDVHGLRPYSKGGLCECSVCPPTRYCDYAGQGWLNDPYQTIDGLFVRANYVLNCTDCHEPHGSPNEFLLRTTVNGVQVNVNNGGPIGGTTSGCWYNFCTACHGLNTNILEHNPSQGCPRLPGNATCYDCHRHCGTGAACGTSPPLF
jgi:hypothetical protein